MSVSQNYDYFFASLDCLKLMLWSVTNFSYEDTPYAERFIITYSNDAQFNHYKNLEFGLYYHSLIGVKGGIEPSWNPYDILGVHDKSIIGYSCLFKRLYSH